MGFMILLNALALLAVGIMSLRSRIVKLSGTAQETIEKVARYQGWIGNIAAGWGVIELIYSLRWAGMMGKGLVALWLTMFIGSMVTILVGVLLGYGMIQQNLLSKASADAQQKIQKVIDRISGAQLPLGYLSIAGGVWTIVYYSIVTGPLLYGIIRGVLATG